MLQSHIQHLLSRPDSELAIASPTGPEALRRDLEAIATQWEAERAEVAARFAKLSHDLRSPVGAILGALDVLEASGALPNSHPMAAVIRQNADRLADIVETSSMPPASARPLVKLCEPDASLVEILRLFLEQLSYRVQICNGTATGEPAEPAALTIVDASQLDHHGVGPDRLVVLGGPSAPFDGAVWLAKPVKKAQFYEAVNQAMQGAPHGA